MAGRVALLLCFAVVRTSCAVAMYPLGLSAAAQLLEVTLPSAKSSVRAAYRKKAAVFHPDVSRGADARENFIRITAAYETLLQFAAPVRAPSAEHATAPHQPPEPAQQSETDLFAQRVAAWRSFWAVSLQATQLASEAERQAVQQSVLSTELARLRELLAVRLRQDGPRSRAVDSCRARYAQCSSRHADVSCAVRTLRARVHTLQREATELQAAAQRVA